MKIGSLALSDPTVLAPLAGITNLPFRLMVKAAGCGLVYSEMISANGLVRGSCKTLRYLDSAPEESPLAVQIFGADPAVLAEAAAIVQASGASIVDINFGCAVRKVIRTGAGVALMQDPERAAGVIRAVRKALSVPLTIKIRTGWESSGAQALALARIAQDGGVDAIAVHPRTAAQGFRGRADWTIISRVKALVSIPVIGNGDITTAQDARSMVEQTGCDGVMVGRAAIGNPWIFSQIRFCLEGRPVSAVDPERRFEIMGEYLRASVRYIGEAPACRMMRSRLGWFAKGLPHAGRFRESVKRIRTEAEGIEKIADYRRIVYLQTEDEATPTPPVT